VNASANVDRGTHVSRCMDGVGMVGIVMDGGVSVCGASDRVGTVADKGTAHVWAHTFAAAEPTQSLQDPKHLQSWLQSSHCVWHCSCCCLAACGVAGAVVVPHLVLQLLSLHCAWCYGHCHCAVLVLWLPLSHCVWCCGCCHCAMHGVMVMVAMPHAVSWSPSLCCVGVAVTVFAPCVVSPGAVVASRRCHCHCLCAACGVAGCCCCATWVLQLLSLHHM